MNFFIRANNSALDADFIAYLQSFKDILIKDYEAEENNLLDMIYTGSVEDADLFEFFESNSNYYSTALQYMLLRDYNIECGLGSPSSNPSLIYKLFDQVAEEFRNNDCGADLMSQFGAAGLFNSFPINDEEIKKDLCSLIYEEIGGSEYFYDDEELTTDFMSEYLCICARLTMVNPRNRESIGHPASMASPDWISNLSDPLFLERSLDEKQSIFNDFFEGMINLKAEEDEESSQENDDEPMSDEEILDDVVSDVKEILRYWPIEIMRSSIILGNSVESTIEQGREIIGVILDKIGYSHELKQEKIEEMIKMALLPFPSSFIEAFGNNPPSFQAVFNSHKGIEDGFGNWSNSGLGFENVSGFYGLSSGTVKVLNQYNNYGEDAINYIIEKSSMPSIAINDICSRSQALNDKQAEKIVSRWIAEMDEKFSRFDKPGSHPNHDFILEAGTSSALIKASHYKGSLYEFMLNSIAETRESIISLGSSELNKLINTYILKALTVDGIKARDGLIFIFENDEDKNDFIRSNLTDPSKINKNVVAAGAFSQKELSEQWSGMVPSVKKSITMSEFGI